MAGLRLFGHYASQPSRSVAWFCKIHAIPFTFEKVEPLKGGTRNSDFAAAFPTRMVPALDDDGFRVTEGAAMLKYLALKHGIDAGYPRDDIKRQAKIDQYLSWHHSNTRKGTQDIFRPVMLHTFFDKPYNEEEAATGQRKFAKVMQRFEEAFLQEARFLQGHDEPSIADLFAYGEISQLRFANLLNLEDTPKVAAWADRMTQVDAHDDVHRTVRKIVDMFQEKRSAA